MICENHYELESSRWSVVDARDVLVLEEHEVEPLIREFYPVDASEAA